MLFFPGKYMVLTRQAEEDVELTILHVYFLERRILSPK